jgi:outer membrane protein
MSTTRNVFAISACLWLVIGTAEAEFIGLNIGQKQLNPTNSRSFQNPNSDSIDLVDDLDMENPEQSSMVLILEHPISVLPNIRYEGYELDSNTSAPGANPSLIGGSQGITDGNSSYAISQNDIVLYYQLLKSKVNLNLGVDLKRFDGEISIAGDATSVSIDETIPLLYLSARFSLPYNGFYVGAQINSDVIDLGLSGSSAQDSSIMLGYDSGNGLGVEGGFKYFSLDLDDINQSNAEFEYDGIYLNGYYNF